MRPQYREKIPRFYAQLISSTKPKQFLETHEIINSKMFKRVFVIFGFCVLVSSLWGQTQRTSQHRVYDANENLSVLITYTYDSLDVVETRQLQSFDLQGRLTRTELYTANEYLLYTEDISYDRYGNRQRCLQIIYDEDGVPTRSDYRYKYTRNPDGTTTLTTIRLNGKQIFPEEEGK